MNWVEDYHIDTFPKARMVRTKDYKYVAFDQGVLMEQLVDMKNDPGEMKNLAVDPDFTNIKNYHSLALCL